MKDTNDILHTFLTLLGFTAEEITVYLTLSQKGALTALELSRTSGISRTQIYRIVEEMEGKGFLEQIIDEHRKLAQAIDIKELAPLIRQKQAEAVELERLFPGVRELVEGNVGANQAETKVLFYRGKHGLRQMVWHTLRAQKEVVGYTFRRLEEYLGYDFMEDWGDAFIKKGLVMRDIYSEEYLTSRKATPPRIQYPKKQYISRFVPETMLKVNVQMDIYNDVVAQYSWHEGDVFGVEIYNTKTAHFERQLFEIVWKLGKPTL